MRRWIRLLRLHKLVNLGLRFLSIHGRLSPSGVYYRVRRAESYALAHEMFKTNDIYRASDIPNKAKTFADLGCNVGYFACLFANTVYPEKPKGLLIDADATVVKEAEWHVQRNKWTDVHTACGVVGSTKTESMSRFFVHESSVCSTARQEKIDAKGREGGWHSVLVPNVCVGDMWRARFGPESCDLLKLDIEGAELDFVKSEQEFLSIVQQILVEWHKWSVDFDVLKAHLASLGFEVVDIVDENDDMGTAVFRRQKTAS